MNVVISPTSGARVVGTVMAVVVVVDGSVFGVGAIVVSVVEK